MENRRGNLSLRSPVSFNKERAKCENLDSLNCSRVGNESILLDLNARSRMSMDGQEFGSVRTGNEKYMIGNPPPPEGPPLYWASPRTDLEIWDVD